jgi:hypothetical protein
MPTPRAFQWSFERSPFDTPGPGAFTTFSVGVFQWLPKSGGKGLKKSKTIRVNGYVADAQRAYDKAEGLCDALNKAEAMIDDPPKWLQKSYSVPMPAEVKAAEPKPDHLTAAQARTLREQVARELLIPAGFVKCADGAYVRREGEQLHLIYFQGSRYGGEFTVNLAFHYTFVPPCFQRKRIALGAVQYLDCMLNTRIGAFLPENRDVWYPYGNDRNALRQTLYDCSRISLRVLDDHAARWRDPATLFPFAQDTPGNPWHGKPAMPLGCIAMRLGRFDAAGELLESWINRSPVHADKPLHQKLLKQLHELRSSKSSRSMIDWFDAR